MKNLKQNNMRKLILVAFLFTTIISCKKEQDFTKTPDGKALGKTFMTNKQDASQLFTLNVSSTSSEQIVTEAGIEFDFNGNSFKDKDGNIVGGEIVVEVIEIFNKGDMALMNMSTMGKLPNGDKAALITGGQFRLAAEKEGDALALNGQVSMKVPTNLTGGGDVDMELFSQDDDCDITDEMMEEDRKTVLKGKPYSGGCPVNNKDVVWEQAAQDAIANPPVGQGGGLIVEMINGEEFYVGLIDQFGWTNVDKFSTYTGPKTTLKVATPEGYNSENTAIYIAFEGEPNALAHLDTYLEDENVFSEHYGQIPVGEKIHVIALSIVENEYAHTIKTVTVSANSTIQLDDLLTSSKVDILTAINDLP